MHGLSVKKRVTLALLAFAAVILGIALLVFTREKEEGMPVSPPVAPEAERGVPVAIGSSVEGRVIEAYTYGAGEKELLFVGGIHGGYEWNSVLLAYRFLDALEAGTVLVPEGVTVSVIPSLNPDGVYRVVGKEGRFTASDVLVSREETAPGRFNAHKVDLNRNFDCKWQPESTWRSATVSAGTRPFSEPEAEALRRFVAERMPETVVFWHSQGNAVYASECEEGILPETRTVMNTYARAAGYPAIDTFDSYAITGDAEGWLASIGIPAITVELKTHETVEWEQNRAGVEALLDYYGSR